jgi:endonuclease G
VDLKAIGRVVEHYESPRAEQTYKGSGFDRGHSVPRDDMNRTFEAQASTFLLSNMSPQTKALNEGIWAYLEERVRAWAKSNGRVHVISGPIFSGTVKTRRRGYTDRVTRAAL